MLTGRAAVAFAVPTVLTAAALAGSRRSRRVDADVEPTAGQALAGGDAVGVPVDPGVGAQGERPAGAGTARGWPPGRWLTSRAAKVRLGLPVSKLELGVAEPEGAGDAAQAEHVAAGEADRGAAGAMR